MFVCDKCGSDNPLGRVFCGSCGSKLDLSRATSDVVREGQRVNLFAEHWPKLLWAVGIVIGLMVVMAFWPKTQLIGEKGTRVGGQRVSSSLRTLTRLPEGRSLKRTFSEKDINGYFQYFKPDDLAYESVSVDVREGTIGVRIISGLGPYSIGPFELAPKISYDLVCVPRGVALRVEKARMGRMNMIGPFKIGIVRKVYKALSRQDGWRAFSDMTEIEAGDNRVSVTAKK